MRAVSTPHCASERLIRAGMLTVSDLKSGMRRICPAAAVMACLYLAYWLVMLLAENTVTPGDRLPVLYLPCSWHSASLHLSTATSTTLLTESDMPCCLSPFPSSSA